MSSDTVKHVSSVVKSIRFLSTICGILASLMIFTSVLVTCQMIWVRYVLNQSTIWQTEAVIYLVIAATIIGLPYVQLHRGHVNVDLLPLLLPEKFRKPLRVFTLVLTIAIISVMAFYGFELFHTALEKNWKSDTVWGVSLWIPYSSMPIGFIMYILQLLTDLYITITDQEETFKPVAEQEENL